MSDRAPETSIRQGVERYQQVVAAQREEAERIRREREEATDQTEPTITDQEGG